MLQTISRITAPSSQASQMPPPPHAQQQSWQSANHIASPTGIGNIEIEINSNSIIDNENENKMNDIEISLDESHPIEISQPNSPSLHENDTEVNSMMMIFNNPRYNQY